MLQGSAPEGSKGLVKVGASCANEANITIVSSSVQKSLAGYLMIETKGYRMKV